MAILFCRFWELNGSRKYLTPSGSSFASRFASNCPFSVSSDISILRRPFRSILSGTIAPIFYVALLLAIPSTEISNKRLTIYKDDCQGVCHFVN